MRNTPCFPKYLVPHYQLVLNANAGSGLNILIHKCADSLVFFSFRRIGEIRVHSCGSQVSDEDFQFRFGTESSGISLLGRSIRSRSAIIRYLHYYQFRVRQCIESIKYLKL